MRIKNNRISQFPRNARKIISAYIYELFLGDVNLSNTEIMNLIFRDLKNRDLNKKWLKKLTYNELDNICKKISLSRYREPFIEYLSDLISIIKKLKLLNDAGGLINFSHFNRELIKDNINLNANERGLEVIIPEIYDYLKNKFKNNFKLKRAKRKVSEKPKSEKRSIELLTKKFKLSKEIYNNKFNGICANKNCNVNFKRLPALDFHHKNPQLKTSSFNDIAFKDYFELKAELEKQDVRLLCKNCHLMENSDLFNSFKELILKKDLFYIINEEPRTAEEINDLIDNEFKNIVNSRKMSVKHDTKYNVKIWIKKRSVIEQIFDGKCISCGESRLPALQFHHSKHHLKKHNWGDIFRKWNIGEIILNFILKEECVCLCANCHSMITTLNFRKNIKEIIGKKHVTDVISDYNKLDKDIEIEISKIKNIRNDVKNFNFIDHLKLMFEKGDSWKKALIIISYITRKLNNDEINQNYLTKILKKQFKFKAYPNLMKNNYIVFIRKEGNLKIYKITEKGKLKARKIIGYLEREHFDDYFKLLEDIQSKIK